MEPEKNKDDISQIKEDINLLMRRIGTIEKEISVITTNINTLREVIRKIIKELSSSPKGTRHIDKGEKEDYDKRERMLFELWGDMSDTEDFGD